MLLKFGIHCQSTFLCKSCQQTPPLTLMANLKPFSSPPFGIDGKEVTILPLSKRTKKNICIQISPIETHPFLNLINRENFVIMNLFCNSSPLTNANILILYLKIIFLQPLVFEVKPSLENKPPIYPCEFQPTGFGVTTAVKPIYREQTPN